MLRLDQWHRNLTDNQRRQLYNEWNKDWHRNKLEWVQSSADGGRLLLRCGMCEVYAASLSNSKAKAVSQMYPAQDWIYYYRNMVLPHIQGNEHQYAATMKRLAGER